MREKSFLFTVPDTEFINAKNYFHDNPGKTKYSRREFLRISKEVETELAQEEGGEDAFKDVFSFIKTKEGKIYAIANRYCFGHVLGEAGSFKKVRLAQDSEGNNYALAVMKAENRNKDEEAISMEENIYKDIVEVTKQEGKEEEEKKLNIIMEYFDIDLYDNYIKTDRINYCTNSERLVLGVKACRAVQALHKKNIIHGDIKIENFMGNKEGNQIVICSIDFGMSHKLKQGENAKILRLYQGTDEFTAPEIKEMYKEVDHGVYSFASDVYSLGIMLSEDLKLDESLCEKMTSPYLGKKDYENIVSMWLENSQDVPDALLSNLSVDENKKRISLNDATDNLLNELKNTLYPSSGTVNFPFPLDTEKGKDDFIRHAELCNQAIDTLKNIYENDPTQQMIIIEPDDEGKLNETFIELVALIENRGDLELPIVRDGYLIIPPETLQKLYQYDPPKKFVEEVTNLLGIVISIHEQFKTVLPDNEEHKIPILDNQFKAISFILEKQGVSLRRDENGALVINDDDRANLDKAMTVLNPNFSISTAPLTPTTASSADPSTEPLTNALDLLFIIYDDLKTAHQQSKEFKIKIGSPDSTDELSLSQDEFSEINTLLEPYGIHLKNEGGSFTMDDKTRKLLQDAMSVDPQIFKLIRGENQQGSEHHPPTVPTLSSALTRRPSEELLRMMDEMNTLDDEDPQEKMIEQSRDAELKMLNAPSPAEALNDLLIKISHLKTENPQAVEYQIKIEGNLSQMAIDVINSALQLNEGLPQKEGYLIVQDYFIPFIEQAWEQEEFLKRNIQKSPESIARSLKDLEDVYSIEKIAEKGFETTKDETVLVKSINPEIKDTTIEDLANEIEGERREKSLENPTESQIDDQKEDKNQDKLEELIKALMENTVQTEDITTPKESLAKPLENNDMKQKSSDFLKKTVKDIELGIRPPVPPKPGQRPPVPPKPAKFRVSNTNAAVEAILEEFKDKSVLHHKYINARPETGLFLLFQHVNILTGNVADEKREKQMDTIHRFIEKLHADTELNSHEKGLVLYGILEKVNKETAGKFFNSRLNHICSTLQNTLVNKGHIEPIKDLQFAKALSSAYDQGGAKSFRACIAQHEKALKKVQFKKDVP